jgi:GNAT superfamily N-acetyltransferase
MYICSAGEDDVVEICKFTDWWLSGRGKKCGVPGASDDCFISPSQHTKYVVKYNTYLVYDKDKLIGWCVIEPSGTLIHMLIAHEYRGRGVGKMLLDLLRPRIVRSKSDQSTGNPGGFYERCGYVKTGSEQSRSRLGIDKIKPSRARNIDIYERLD